MQEDSEANKAILKKLNYQKAMVFKFAEARFSKDFSLDITPEMSKRNRAQQ